MYHNNINNDQVIDNSTASSKNCYRIEDLQNLNTPPQSFKHQNNRSKSRTIALLLSCALIAGGAGAGGAALYHAFSSSTSSSSGITTITENMTPSSTVSGTTVQIQQANGLTPMSFTQIYNTYANSCVAIVCYTDYVTNTWYGPYSSTSSSSGSGFVISDNGYIVTNYHILNESGRIADRIKVSFPDGTEYDASYVGGDSSNDLAVLKIDATNLTPVVLGDSDSLSVGEPVSTIGNALGTFSFSQTAGIVSGLSRSITYADGTMISMMQTDCTINSGNSGGPLFDQYGRVVGITSAKYSSSGFSSSTIENISFAIPINDVKDIITNIMEHGYAIRPYMGISAATVTDEYSKAFGWPYGAYVNSVESGSCAETAGIQKGDIITKLGDTEITSSSSLTLAKNEYSVGDTVPIVVCRAGEYLTLSITFDASPDPTIEKNTSSSPSQNQN